MEERQEYLKAIKEMIDFLESKNLNTDLKFKALKRICFSIVNDIDALHNRYIHLEDLVLEMNKNLISSNNNDIPPDVRL